MARSAFVGPNRSVVGMVLWNVMEIREAKTADAVTVAAIYNHYVQASTITFEEKPISAQEMAGRMVAVSTQNLFWFVAVKHNLVVGYAYATPWKSRSAYRHSTELTVYVAAGNEGKGVGTGLYRRILPALKSRGCHTVLAGIALPNPASITLHERFGFKKVAHLSEVGFKMQRWIDVGYWQLLLDGSDTQTGA